MRRARWGRADGHGQDHGGKRVNGPVRSDYAPSWYTATAVAAPERAPLATDLDVDVCVVGAGLAGLTTAREIARSGWSVAVLEARRIAWNASGLNCGFVLPGFAVPIARIIERVGRERAKDLWRLSELGLEYVRTTIAEADMPGVDPVDGWLNVSKTEDAEGLIATLQLLGGEFGVEVEGWAMDRVRQTLKTNRYFNAIHFPRAFHVHPLNYALALAALAESARIFSSAHRRSRSIPKACASGSRRRTADCAPLTWCLPETCISASSCGASAARFCRSGPIWPRPRPSVRRWARRSPIAARSAMARAPTTIIAWSTAIAC
jgi:hypothetical protein